MQEIHDKFHAFASPVVGEKRTSEIEGIIMQMGEGKNLNDLLDVLIHPA